MKLTSGSITPQEKVSCIAIRIMLENILDSFHSIETKEGQGLLSKTVKWMETETAFNNDINPHRTERGQFDPRLI